MEKSTEQSPKKIVLTYADNVGGEVDISLKSEGFGDDVELITLYLHETIASILSTREIPGD